MKVIESRTLICSLLWIFVVTSCQLHQEQVDIRPHVVNAKADSIYQKAMVVMRSSFDVDSTRKCISLLDAALAIDSLNPDYYGMKAKLLSEMGELDWALHVQTLGMERKAITGEYLFQLALFQAAKDMETESHENFGKSRDFLQAVLEQYPDSLGAFILAEAANSLYLKVDSAFMNNITDIRKRFPDRLMEIEMTRRVKPQSLIRQIKNIQIEKDSPVDFDLDSLVMNAAQNNEQEAKRHSTKSYSQH